MEFKLTVERKFSSTLKGKNSHLLEESFRNSWSSPDAEAEMRCVGEFDDTLCPFGHGSRCQAVGALCWQVICKLCPIGVTVVWDNVWVARLYIV